MDAPNILRKVNTKAIKWSRTILPNIKYVAQQNAPKRARKSPTYPKLEPDVSSPDCDDASVTHKTTPPNAIRAPTPSKKTIGDTKRALPTNMNKVLVFSKITTLPTDVQSSAMTKQSIHKAFPKIAIKKVNHCTSVSCGWPFWRVDQRANGQSMIALALRCQKSLRGALHAFASLR